MFTMTHFNYRRICLTISLLVAGLPSLVGAAETYFTQGSPTSSPTVDTFNTGSTPLGMMWGGGVGAFASSTAALANSQGLPYIDAVASTGAPGGNSALTIDTNFPSFAGVQNIFVTPDNAPSSDTRDGFTTGTWNGTSMADYWDMVVTFNVDDLSLYSEFFLDSRSYGDDSISGILNGNPLSLASTNPNWYTDPGAVGRTMIPASNLFAGSNTLILRVANDFAGASGIAAYGRFGATQVPEPTGSLLGALAGGVLLARRARKK